VTISALVLVLLGSCGQPESGENPSTTAVVDGAGRRSVSWTSRAKGETFPDTLLDPMSERIVLAQGKDLFVRSIDGAFSLTGGDTLHITWANGVIRLNGHRFRPSSALEAYARSQRLLKKSPGNMYAVVPFLAQHLAIHGDSEATRARALREWDSTMSWLELEAECDLRRRLPLSRCRQLILDRDQDHLIDSVVVRGAGMLVYWKALRQPSAVQDTHGERVPLLGGRRAVLSSEAAMAFRFFERELQSQSPSAIDIDHGNIDMHSSRDTVRANTNR
jgi:hypothetical protein